MKSLSSLRAVKALDLDALLAPIREAAAGLPREALPPLLGALEELRCSLLLGAAPVEDKQLSPAEVAKRLRRSLDWVYAHADELPTTRWPGGRWTCSERALSKWISGRTG